MHSQFSLSLAPLDINVWHPVVVVRPKATTGCDIHIGAESLSFFFKDAQFYIYDALFVLQNLF